MTSLGEDFDFVSVGALDGRGNSGKSMFCLIVLGGKSFAIQTSAVREVIGSALIVKVPLAPEFMAGLVNHRGVMLTTVSLRSVLGMPPAERGSCVVVMRPEREGGECFGLLVDELAGVLTLESRAMENIPPTVTDSAQRVLRGLYVREQGPLVELDAEQLRPERLAALDQSGHLNNSGDD